ncbi:MBL fold metallo-hydrolase [Streptomyces sp. CBMA152]|uniref:MBL fold metallo-hydrolase n=1 Tax=Streptomyces sp. CBMA152 TaxID=1896312 RepID=UPI0016609F95|nr:MBL fold metallo-hydrolase [Streptomyces sp. CBMA152]MBD0745893.1 MBL fold metallo-hydrolase [Streptomyces sp. CBMA152]
MPAPDRSGQAGRDWEIDESCIDCDVARQLAPQTVVRLGSRSVLARQPSDAREHRALERAAAACPVRAIRRGPGRIGEAPFPMRIEGEVHLCGHNSARTFGANAYLVRRPEGNLLVDTPRWTSSLAASYERLGGIAHILLTHRDHTAHARRFAEHFGSRVWIHEGDADAAPYADTVLRGTGPTEVLPGVTALPVPGHTRGSTVYVVDERYCFTGDTLYWSRTARDLEVFETVLWYSRPELIDSLLRLARRTRFAWVLPGHGDRCHRPAEELHERLLDLVARMRRRSPRPLDIGAVEW